MAAVKTLNPKAEVARAQAALAVNISAARGLQDVLRTNLGPKGTMKMLVSGAGDIKLTKDGNVLLHEMQIQHPTASLIAKVATAQDDITGDGTTSNVLIIGELLKQADLYISEGLHPRIITEGFEAAKEKALQFLEQVKVSKEMDRETLIDVARTSLRTKVHAELADVLTETLDILPSFGYRMLSETFTVSELLEALIKYKPSVKGRAQLGVQAFADALLIIPKVLAQNSGFDLQETLVKVQAEHSESGQLVGVDLNTGEPMVAAEVGIWDNYCVKKQLLHSCTVIATNILLVDEIMRAGMSSLKG
ncbi:T-complex protein 1 subunit zeta [Puma concolor]|uniref:T-complex protein 1 subunit zeta n=1 Tax=Puma concolor TaxID=9696 RepID=A0A6P6HSP6_PUMCO|nr:T-complex protein 1 subunit zeta [Puma concolor]